VRYKETIHGDGKSHKVRYRIDVYGTLYLVDPGTGDPTTRDPGTWDPGTQIGMHCACTYGKVASNLGEYACSVHGSVSLIAWNGL